MIKSINSICISGECKRNVLSNTVFMLCDSVGIDYLEMEHYDVLVVGFAVKPRFRDKGITMA